MFERLRLWLAGSSGLQEAARDGARAAVRQGTLEGVRLGLEDALSELTGLVDPPAKIIDAQANGTHDAPRITPAELGRMRKADLIDLAQRHGIDADETWTAGQLRERLAEPVAG